MSSLCRCWCNGTIIPGHPHTKSWADGLCSSKIETGISKYIRKEKLSFVFHITLTYFSVQLQILHHVIVMCNAFLSDGWAPHSHSWDSQVAFNRKTEETAFNDSLQAAISTSAMADLNLSGGQQPGKELSNGKCKSSLQCWNKNYNFLQRQISLNLGVLLSLWSVTQDYGELIFCLAYIGKSIFL